MREVAQFMLAKQADGTGESDLDAQIDQEVFQPFGTLKAVMYEFPVTAE